MGDTPAGRESHQQVSNAPDLGDRDFVFDGSVCVLSELLAQVRRQEPFGVLMGRTFRVRPIIAGAAANMREVVLTHEPRFHDHWRIAHLTDTLSLLECRAWILDQSDIDPLSRSFQLGDKWHG